MPDRARPTKLSFAQQRLWFLDQLVPGSVDYTVVFGWRLTGELDVTSLEAALAQVIGRHEVLRTRFASADGEPYLILDDAPAVRLPVLAGTEADIEKRLQLLADHPFNLATGPLWRSELLRIADDQHLFFFAAHHIAMDAWSAQNLVDEIGECYRASRTGRPAILPELPLQYAEFAALQRERLDGPLVEEQLGYWLRTLAGVAPLDLPTDRPRGSQPSGAGDWVDFSVPEATAAGLRALAREQRASLFMVLLAGVQLLLSRYAGHTDIALGTPIVNRDEPEAEPLIGFFANTLVLRGDLSGDPTFRQLLERTRERTLDAYDHKDLPFERLVEALRPDRDLAAAPLFQAMLVMNTSFGRMSLQGLQVESYPAEALRSKFDLTAAFVDDEDGLQGTLRYSTELFDADRMRRMAEHLLRVLAEVVADADRPVSELPMLAGPEWRELIEDYSAGPAAPPAALLHQLVERQAASRPDAPAVTGLDGQSLTYRQLNEAANRLAHRLRARGAGPETPVAVCLTRSVNWLVSLLATLKSGGIYLPLDPDYPDERKAFLLADAGAALAVVDAGSRALLPTGFTGPVLDLDHAGSQALSPDTDPQVPLSDDNAAYLVFTSGSTGRPKGVLASHANASTRIQTLIEDYQLSPADTGIAMAGMGFDSSIREVFGVLAAGGRLVLAEPGIARDPAAVAELLVRQQVTVLLSVVPSLLYPLAGQRADGIALRLVLCSGERLRPERLAGCDWITGILVNQFGPTEATMTATRRQLPVEPDQPSNYDVGRPVAGTQSYLLDTSMAPCPIGVSGELYLGGPGISRGYRGRPASTAERFLPNPFGPGRLYRTGDICRWSADGTLLYLGRNDQQLKIRGLRVEPGEIEAALRAVPGIADAVVIGQQADGQDPRLIGYLVPDSPEQPSTSYLRHELERTLPAFLVPSIFLFLSTFPLTANGKIDRRALPEPDSSRPELEAGYLAPRTELEARIAEVWSQVLGIDQVGVSDNFFDLGGHSLLATQVVSRLSRLVGTEVPLRALFSTPTVSGLASWIGSRRVGRTVDAIARVDRTKKLELSFAQQRLWFLEQFAPESGEYALPIGWRLRGQVDLDALRASLAQLVARHEVLRTTYSSLDGRPSQRIEPTVEVSLPVVEQADEAAVATLVEELVNRKFDLANGPLWRVLLIRTGADEQVLVLVLHHIVADAWSAGVLLRELSDGYQAARTGEPLQLPELKVQYADFAAWQRGRLTGSRLTEQLDYWRTTLAGSSPLELPTDRPRATVRDGAGASLGFTVGPELTAGLRELARSQRVTTFSVILACVQILLGKYSGQDDVLVGTPIANRNRPEIEPLIGFFVNTLVLRGDLSGDPSFQELLDRVREVTLGAYEHQDLPFERLVEELQPDRDLARTPLFQAMLSVNNTEPTELALPGVEVSDYPVSTERARFDLTVAFHEAADSMQAIVHYSTALFDADRIERLCDHLRRLLVGVVADPKARLSELTLVDGPERQLVQQWATGPDLEPLPGDPTLLGLIEEQVRRQPNAVAVSELPGASLTFGELDRRANQLAHRLRELGAGSEQVIGICLDRSIGSILAILATLKSGAAYLPVEPTHPADRLAFMFNDAGCDIVLTNRDSAAGTAGFAGRLIDLSDPDTQADLDRRPVIASVPANHPDQLAYLMYTSGSTGKPKGVQVTHRGLLNYLRWASENYRFEASAGAILHSSLAFDMTVTSIFVPLLKGTSVCLLADGTDAGGILEAGTQAAASLVKLTPTHLRMLADAADRANLRFPAAVIVGGEALPTAVVNSVLADLPSGGYLVNEYGPTETVVGCCAHFVDHPLPAGGDSVPIGRPIANTQVYVLDSAMALCPAGVPGELYVGGSGVSRGYAGRPGLTAERFVPNPFGTGRLYRTGDLCRWSADGVLRYFGRTDHQVKVRGYRIELGEIETRLQAHPGVSEVTVVARPDAAGEQRLVGYLVTAGEQPSVTDLRSWLETELPSYLVPSTFVFLAELPLSGSGKVDLRALPEPDSSRPELVEQLVYPRTPAEELVAGVWREILGLSEIGVFDNFFALGGHSLLATQVISRLASLSGSEVPLRMLFQEPTVAGLAASIGAAPDRRQVSRIERLDRTGPIPLSFAQQRLWFLDQLYPASADYISPLAWELTGELDVAALRGALSRLVERHEVLRTTFSTVDGKPCQNIADTGSIDLAVAAADEVDLPRLVQEFSYRPFELSRGPLCRAMLFQLASDRQVLVLAMHHIVADAWSAGVLVTELASLYRAAISGTDSGLPALPVQYADFAGWQRDRLRGELLTEQLDYWRATLADLTPLALPTDRPAASNRSSAGSSVEFLVPPAIATELRALADRQQVTLFMVILAAFQAVLGRYCGQDDIAVGSAIANRNRAEIEPLIGFFVNTLVLRGDLSGDPSFRELLGRVREVTLGAYENQDLPFERLVDELSPQRDLSTTPLFQTMLSVDNTPPASWQLPGIEVREFELASEQAKFDLTLAFADGPAGLQGTIRYSTALFDRDRIERLGGHLDRLLASAVANPDARLSELELLTEPEQRLLIDGRTLATGRPDAVRTLHQLVERQARLRPDRLAVVDTDGASLTYQELNQQANQLARQLRAMGASAELLVGICMTRSVSTVLSLLAVLKAGAAYLPLDPDYPTERLAFILADADAEIVVTDTDLVPGLTKQVLDLADPATRSSLAEQPTGNLDLSIHPDNLAYVIYTSGSTGKPKGVQVTHANACRLFEVTAEQFGFDEHQVWLSTHSYAFDFSVWEIWGALTTGGRAVLASYQVARDPQRLAAVIAEQQVTMLSQTPTAFRTLMGVLQATGPAALRYVVFGGEALDLVALRPWFADPRTRGVRLVNMYGITETTVHVTWLPLTAETLGDAAASPIGRPLADLRTYLLDRQLAPVPIGVAGELYVGGAGLSRGYLARPGLTADRFVPDPFGTGRLYRTGDLGRWTAEGTLEYLGRSDHQVKIRGFRIELGEIEARLIEHPEVSEAIVLAREDKPGDRRLVGYLIAPAELPVSQLRAWLERTLPGYMVPAAFVQLNSLPLTASGKVDRGALPAPGTARPELADGFVAARSELEVLLAEIWASVLGLDRVGMYDNFFDLGGDSILSIQIVARAVAAGVRLTPRMVFEHQTIAEMATASAAQPTAQVEHALVLGPAPLTPIQRWFFARALPEPDHYNQSVLLTVPPELTEADLAAMLADLVGRHSALRLRFLQRDGQWVQESLDRPPGDLLRTVDLGEGGASRLTDHANRLQADLDIRTGRVFGGLLANLGSRGRRLLLVAHHLVIDGVSWRILLDDLQAGYRKQPGGPAAASTPFPRWAMLLEEYAVGPAAAAELPYWHQIAAGGGQLRCDYPAGENTVLSAAEVTVALSSERTRALLHEVPAAYRTRINDVLLTALALALRPLTGGGDVSVDVEGHGREDLLLPGVDLSRTVGWFTAIYPVRLHTGPGWSVPNLLKQTKQSLREVPNGGLGYGILRYLAASADRSLVAGSQLLFNYLGQFDNVLSAERGFLGADEDKGASQASSGLRSHPLEINSEVVGGVFRARFGYSRNLHRQETVTELATEFIGQLEAVIEHCLTPGNSGAVPADFPLAGIDQDTLDALLDGYRRDT
ncbi:MAG: amino acid adenylation domain-containing protein [Actinomycetota bacterium]|nr:amino acid adenylation domain-containing protein [Actinomycetota bacterium]MDQ2955636.1 amino acid adenylation domain-containing protein [Actinomycetota bacterium]